jgi:hypothetical protein
MGHWDIHILGHGVHHNGLPEDADNLLCEFVGKLCKAGHDVHSATITGGSTTHIGIPMETNTSTTADKGVAP